MVKLEKNKNWVLHELDTRNYLYNDRYGNYLFTDDNNKRYKPKKTVLVKQQKINGRWITIWSKYYKDLYLLINF